ncbi:hypothetical protein A4H02_04755 [Fervidobacterium thailandense]|uniref:GAF domain-containing protein n=1 Tax=Fervidobacterium thailandense TaxID=1008305 RepID=A0A1E3G379_9BACT|nr:hypothetical protein A4H02_04755 [Fervidobacterium thailandense]
MKNLRYVLEYVIFVFVILLLTWIGRLPANYSVLLLILGLFLWAVRYGLALYVFGLIVTEIILLTRSFNSIFEYRFSFESISLILVIGGLPLGIVGEIFRKRIKTLENEKSRLQSDLERLYEDSLTLKSVVEQLQMRIYFEGEGLIVLLERLKELEVFDVDEIITRAIEMIAEFFGLSNLHFYKMERDFLRYVAGIGKKILPNAFELSKSKVIEMATRRGSCTITDVLMEGTLTETYEPWFAVSVGERERVFGVLVSEEIEPTKFSQVLVRYIHSIASWLYANIRVVAEQEKFMEERFKNIDGTWKEEYYEYKKRIMEKRLERFGVPYREVCLEYNATLHESILGELRKSDVACAIRFGDKVRLKVLLAVCDDSGKERFLERLKRKYEIRVC